VKAITIRQPWAWAVVFGIKRVENRTWATRYRGPRLIHAGKSRASLGREADLLPGLPPYDELPYRAIVGVVTLVDCVPVDQAPPAPFTEGPWCWILADARPFRRPIPHRGLIRLFEVDDLAGGYARSELLV
jgi:hypothetical protein